MRIQTNQTVGELVATQPSRARVFEDFRIDYCCGGKRSLDEACRERGLDAGAVVRALEAEDARRREVTGPVPVDWTKAPLAELVDDILERHHAYLRRELPHLRELMGRVRRAHGENHPELHEVDSVFTDLADELIAHLMKEEQILFPAITTLEVTGKTPEPARDLLAAPIGVMEHEHDEAAAALRKLRHLTADFTVPEDGCPTYRALLAGLADLERDLHEHVHKENNVLFPRAQALQVEVRERAGGAGQEARS